jgi:alpha-galactosidase
VDRSSGARYSGAHLVHIGLPFDWSPDFDADAVVLDKR